MTKRILKKTIEDKRSFLFAVGVFVALQSLIRISNFKNPQVFGIALVLGMGFLTLELFTAWLSVQRRRKSLEMPNLSSRQWREHFTHHALLPMLVFVFTALFIWNNNIHAFKQVFVLMTSLLYLPLFVNIHATYRSNVSVRKETSYIFDFFRVAIFFLGVDVILSIDGLGSLDVLSKSLLTSLLGFIMIFLMIWLARQINFLVLALSLLFSLFLGLILFLLVTFVILNPLTLAIIITLGFYLIITYWHHKLEGNFDFYLFSEYFLIAVILLVLLIGLR